MRVGLLPVAVVDLMSLLLAPVTRPQQIESGGAMDIGSRLELFRFEGQFTVCDWPFWVVRSTFRSKFE